MSPKPSVVHRHGPPDEWNKFRPARDLRAARRKRRRVPVLLVVLTALFFAFLLADQLRPRVEAALTYAARFALPSKPKEIQFPRAKDSAKRSARPYRAHNRRDPSFSRSPELGPFDAYVLDGSRYIRVEGKDSYALVDTKTGKVTWITKAGKHQADMLPKFSRKTTDGLPRDK